MLDHLLGRGTLALNPTADVLHLLRLHLSELLLRTAVRAAALLLSPVANRLLRGGSLGQAGSHTWEVAATQTILHASRVDQVAALLTERMRDDLVCRRVLDLGDPGLEEHLVPSPLVHTVDLAALVLPFLDDTVPRATIHLLHAVPFESTSDEVTECLHQRCAGADSPIDVLLKTSFSKALIKAEETYALIRAGAEHISVFDPGEW